MCLEMTVIETRYSMIVDLSPEKNTSQIWTQILDTNLQQNPLFMTTNVVSHVNHALNFDLDFHFIVFVVVSHFFARSPFSPNRK
jgi:hypothetical protein